MLRTLLIVIGLVALSGCQTSGERWQPVDGKLTNKKKQLFVKDKRACFLKIQDAKLAGLEDNVARLAYYHCMQAKGWALID